MWNDELTAEEELEQLLNEIAQKIDEGNFSIACQTLGEIAQDPEYISLLECVPELYEAYQGLCSYC